MAYFERNGLGADAGQADPNVQIISNALAPWTMFSKSPKTQKGPPVPGPGEHGNNELQVKSAGLQAKDLQLANLGNALRNARQNIANEFGPQSQLVAQLYRLLDGAVSDLTSLHNDAVSAYRSAQKTYGSFQGSTLAWDAMDAVEQEISSSIERHTKTAQLVQAAVGKARVVKAQQDAQAQTAKVGSVFAQAQKIQDEEAQKKRGQEAKMKALLKKAEEDAQFRAFLLSLQTSFPGGSV